MNYNLKKNKIIYGWGKNIAIKSTTFYPKNIEELSKYLKSTKKKNFVTRGLARSYGDSSLSGNTISLQNMKKKFCLDIKKGFLECSANFSIEEILEKIIKKGWFLNVTPGSKYVTIGGAIGSDVHGKNHHLDGTFCNFIISLKIITSDGKIYNCSNKKFSDLFYSTCGGMGLTGIVLSAKIKLQKIKSNLIDVQNIKTKNLNETIDLFEKYKKNKYLVAWLDATEKKNIGRSILLIGNHANKKGSLTFLKKKKISVPGFFPGFFMNNLIINLLNKIYYLKYKDRTKFKQNLENFFYPLDQIINWNNFYGKDGFVQIQILLVDENYKKILNEIIVLFQENNQYSFLTTLKKLGPKNKNYLSFPDRGYTITFDIKVNKNLPNFYKTLEKLLSKYNSKIYLTKDSLMSKKFFDKKFKDLTIFKKIKNKYDKKKLFSSKQSIRLGITK